MTIGTLLANRSAINFLKDVLFNSNPFLHLCVITHHHIIFNMFLQRALNTRVISQLLSCLVSSNRSGPKLLIGPSILVGGFCLRFSALISNPAQLCWGNFSIDGWEFDWVWRVFFFPFRFGKSWPISDFIEMPEQNLFVNSLHNYSLKDNIV